MTTFGDQPDFGLFGQPMTDPLADVALRISLRTLADVAEMNRIGFDTESWFDPQWLAPFVGSDKGVFKLTSLQTKVEYLVDLQVHANGTYYATVQIYDPIRGGQGGLYKMMLVRADNGTIRMNVDWQVPTTTASA